MNFVHVTHELLTFFVKNLNLKNREYYEAKKDK